MKFDRKSKRLSRYRWISLISTAFTTMLLLLFATETLSFDPPPRKPGEPAGFSPTPIPIIKPKYKTDDVAPKFLEQKNQSVNLESVPSPDPKEPIQLHLRVYHTSNYKFAARISSIVVTASVESIGDAHWTTPEGSRPENIYTSNEGYSIVTPVTFLIKDSLKGDLKIGERVTIFAKGGKVGEDSLETDDERDIYTVGETVLLFLNRYPDAMLNKVGIPPDQLFVLERYSIDDKSSELRTRSEQVSMEQVNKELVLVSTRSGVSNKMALHKLKKFG